MEGDKGMGTVPPCRFVSLLHFTPFHYVYRLLLTLRSVPYSLITLLFIIFYYEGKTLIALTFSFLFLTLRYSSYERKVRQAISVHNKI